MATESPIRMPVTGGKWPNHGRVTAPNRSGSAPPSMEGSFLAIDNILSQQKLGFNKKLPSFHCNIENHEFEEPLLSDPCFLAYYSSELKLNPKLSPPNKSRRNQFDREHIGEFRTNWGLTNINSPIRLSQGAQSTDREVYEDDESPQQSVYDVLDKTTSSLSGKDAPLASDLQYFNDLGQEGTSHDPTPVHSWSDSSNYEVIVAGERDAPTDLSEDVTSTLGKDSEADSTSSSFHDCTGIYFKPDVSVCCEKNPDVFIIMSKMKNTNISSPPNPPDQKQWKHHQINSLQKQPNPQQQNNVVRNQSAKSQMSPLVLNNAYVCTDQFLHGPPSRFSADVQPLLQSSGFTPPPYATNPTVYMTSPSPLYNMQSPSLYSSHYDYGVYPLTPNPAPQFFTGYAPHGAIPFAIDPNFIGQPSGVLSGGNVVAGAEIQCFDKLYEQVGQPSLVDPYYMQYYQQQLGQAYGMPGLINPVASGGAVVGNQNNVLELQKDEQKFTRQISEQINQNLGKMVMMNPNYYVAQPNVGVMVQYPPLQLCTPVLPGPGTYVGVYSGWQGQRGLERPNEPRLCDFLEELKSGKGRRFELADIAGRIVEFSADQHGSRFIQQKLEKCSLEEKASVFKEVLPHACILMTDVFGNYVIQKFFEYGSSAQKKELANQLTGQMLPLSLQMYGCRVIQKALDVIEPEQKARLVKELERHVMRCVCDQNGNHVIQKCIESVPADKIGFIIASFRGQVASLSMHPYGCRVIQRVLEHCAEGLQCRFIVNEILESVCALSRDQYGNYVTQHVLERGTPQERASIVRKLSGYVVQLSQHKFASNVIEKCLECGGPTERELIIEEIAGHNDGIDHLLTMMKDRFGNYVVQRICETCTDDQRARFLSRIRMHANALKKFTYGKHIVARLEQLLGEETQGSSS